MATEHINDVFITQSIPLFQVSTAGATKVSLSVTTQIAAEAEAHLKVRFQGSNDFGYWHPLGGSDTNVGLLGSKGVVADIDGFLWVRAYFTRTGNTTPLISATINTGN
jgi:hypothetical protein